MTQLIDRAASITVGDLRIATVETPGKPMLRIAFNVLLALARDPNKAQLKIWNLSATSRAKIQEQDRLPVVINAGYIGMVAQLFFGDMRFGNSEKEGSDWVTTLEAGDGAKQYRSARISESFAAGTKVTDVLKKAAEALGIGVGNLTKVIAAGSKRIGLTEFTNGTVLSGKASEAVDGIVKSMGLEWSIQSGQLQILEPDQTTQDDAILLTPSTGLIGSPTAGEKGRVKARSLLQPDITPGRRVKIESATIDGAFFKTEKVRHQGDTWGNDWFSDMELKPL